MLELGITIFLGGIAAWMYFTTPRIREVVFGYVIFFGVILFIIGLFTGNLPNSVGLSY